RQYRGGDLHGVDLHLHRAHHRPSFELNSMRLRLPALLSLSLLLVASPRVPLHGQATDSVAPKPAGSVGQAAHSRLKQKQRQRYDPYFKKYSKRFFGVGFDWRLFKAQGMAESELNPNARSFVGARGIMQ